LQEETGGFTAFTPVAFQPQATGMQGFEEATAVEYLKTLAISRMYLDNIVNVQADLETQGLKVLQMGLRFGGNDVGSVKPEDAGSLNGATEEQLRQVIRDAGFRPVQRDTVYRTMFLN
jgi:cyclic dehypoxanthinyl futalosine synthase